MSKHHANLQHWLTGWGKRPELQWVPKILTKFPSATVYLVGGMVRDIALDRPSKDFDLVVTGVLARHLEAELAKMGTVDLVGKSFGVFKFVPKGHDPHDPIDVALPRREHAFGTGGYRDVNVQSDHRLPIADDLSRRDFTINAMALQLLTGNFRLDNRLADPFGGMADLAAKKIRAVGKPEERFREDYSRMLRAVRFACQLDFEIETATWRALKRQMKNLNHQANGERVVPYEVIAKELAKALAAHPVWALELLDDSGVVKLLMPELLRMKKCPQPPQFHSEGDVWAHTVLALGKLGSPAFRREFPKTAVTPELVWATLFHDVGKPYTLTFADRIRTNGHDIKSAELFRAVAERIKLSSTGLNVTAVEQVIAKHLIATHAKKSEMKETTVEKYFYSDRFPGRMLLQLTYVDIGASIPPSGRPDFSCYRRLKQRVAALGRRLKSKRVLPPSLLDGHEIMALLKIPPSVKIKEVKEFLRELQLAGKMKTKAQAKKAIFKKFRSA
ncbi:MAG: HD domain-containing protein [Patescibacteria group bacterium]|nr:HD domain-containing protein [Patescibacteria group bacterium]